MSQINVDPGGARDSGTGGIIAVLLVLVLVAFLVWALAFGGFANLTGRAAAPPASRASTGQSGATVNIAPNVNVQPAGGAAAGGGAPAKP